MNRLVPLLLCAAILSACSEDDAGRGTMAGGKQPPPGPFTLELSGDAADGARLPVEVEGDARGVELVLWRIRHPLEVLTHFPDPDDAAVRGWLRPPIGPGREFRRVWTLELTRKRTPELPRVNPGLYLVAARRGSVEATRCVLVPGVTVVARRTGSEILLFAVDPETGVPVRGAEVILTGGSEERIRRTDGSGVLRASGVSPLPVIVLAAAGDRPARPVLLPPSDLQARGGGEVTITTDRPVYLPGEAVSFRVVEIEPTGERIRLWPIEERVFHCFAADGRRLARGTLTGEVGGTLWGSFPLPADVAPGPARLDVGTWGNAVTIAVAEPGTPPVRVGIRWESAIPGKGHLIQVFIRAEDRFGRSLKGDLVTYTIERVSTRDGPHEPVTIAAGNAMLSEVNDFRTGFEAVREGRYRIEARVETASGDTATARETVEVAGGLFALEIEPDRLNCVPGEYVELLLRKVPTPVYRMTITGEVAVGSEKTPFRMHVTEEETRVKVRIPAPGCNVIRAKAADSLGRGAEATAEVWAVPDETADWAAPRMILIPDRRRYASGEKARVLLLLPPELEGSQVLFSVEHGIHAVEQVLGRFLWIDAEVPDRTGDFVVFRAAAVRRGVVHEAKATAAADRSDRRVIPVVRLDPGRTLPGGEVLVQVEARTMDGKPSAGFAALTIYDAELDGAAAADAPIMISRRTDRLLLWEPYLSLGQDGFSAVQPITMPDRGGRWRVRAVVVCADGRRGIAEALIRAEPPVSLEVSPPPYLVEGDEVQIRAGILSRQPVPARGEIRISAQDRSLEGSLRMPCAVAIGDEASGETFLRALAPGKGRVTAEFTGVEGTRAEADIPVLPRFGAVVSHVGGILPKGRSRAVVTLPGAEEATLRVTLDLGLLPAVHRAAEALAAMPDATADGLANQFAVGAALASVARERLLGTTSALDRARGLAPLGLARLEARQREDGGWSWCGEAEPDAETTRAVARALARTPDSDEALALLESAARYLDRKNIRLDPRPSGTEQTQGELAWWGAVDARSFGGDAIEATSGGILALLGDDTAEAKATRAAAARYLLTKRRGATWKSSRDTAAACFALLALAEARAEAGEGPRETLVRVRRGRVILGNTRLTPDDLLRGSATFEKRVRPDRRGRVTLHFESSAADVVSWTATLEGAGEHSRAKEPGLSIAFYPSTWGTVERGDVIEVNLELRSDTEERYLVVDSPFPAGTEPIRRSPVPLTIPDPPPGTCVQFLTDRVRFLVPRIPAGETNLGYTLRAVRRGKFHDRPASVSLAYFPRVRAESSVEPPLSVR